MSKSAKLLLILLASLIAILYAQIMLAFTGGIWILPLDDTYIYLQYAKNLANGHFLQFNAGDPPSTGTTSLLYPFFLTVGFLLGLNGDQSVIYTFVLNTIFLAVSLILVFSLMKQLFDEVTARVSSAAFVLCGPLTWGYFTGMEIGIVTTLFLLSAIVWMREEQAGRLRITPWMLCLLAIARPESMLFVFVIVLLLLFFKRRSQNRFEEFLVVFAPIMVIAGIMVLNHSLTGNISPNTAHAKSPIYTPYFSFLFLLQHVVNYFAFVIKGLFLGTYTEPLVSTQNRIDQFGFVPPLSLFFYLIGGIPPAIKEIRDRRLGTHLFLNLWFLTGFFSTGFLSGSGAHHFRYLLPFLCVFVIYLFPGIRVVARALASTLKEVNSAVFEYAIVGVFLFFQLLTTFNFMLLFGQTAHAFREYKDVASWTQKNLDSGSRIAALDIGMIGFYGGRYIYDLLGLATNEMTSSTFYFSDYMGSKYEKMKKLQPQNRPEYFLLHKIRFDERGDEGHLQPFRQQLIYQASPVSTQFPAIGRNLGIYKFDWNENANSSNTYESAARSNQLLDSINIADLDSEKAHDYSFIPGQPQFFPSNRVVQALYPDGTVIMDGAMGIDGTERFRFHAPDKSGVILVLRTLYIERVPQVFCNGVASGYLQATTDGKNWKEVELRIPAAHIVAGENWLEIRGRYMSAYYWIYQDKNQ